jgi:hypothetical protein
MLTPSAKRGEHDGYIGIDLIGTSPYHPHCWTLDLTTEDTVVPRSSWYRASDITVPVLETGPLGDWCTRDATVVPTMPAIMEFDKAMRDSKYITVVNG